MRDGVNGAEIQQLRSQVQFHQSPIADGAIHEEARAVDEAHARHRRLGKNLPVVRMERAAHRHRAAAVAAEAPARGAGLVAQRVAEAVMPCQIVQRMRRPAPSEIGGRSTDRHPHGRELAGDEIAVRQSADAHGDIPTLLQQVDHTVVQPQFHGDGRMAFVERGNEIDEVGAAESGRPRDAQQPLHRRGLGHGLRIGILQFRQHALGLVEIGSPHFGKRKAARRAVRQGRAEALFQRIEVLGRHRRRHREIARRCRKAAQTDRLDENLDALQPVHSTPLIQSHSTNCMIITNQEKV
ncbi:hypothetical protein ADT71_08890 [Novosphingobium sp. ST904]|nr:hypothetical protein ADT71_08890 [Novosphingobium sp. ST904]